MYCEEDEPQPPVEKYIDKNKLVEKFKRLIPEQLGIIIQTVIDSCPDAFKPSEEGKYSLCMDLLDQDFCAELNEYVIHNQEK